MLNLLPKLFSKFLLGALCLCLGLLPGVPALAGEQQEALYQAIMEFEILGQDKQRGMRRDQWENLEKRFSSIQNQGNAFAAEAHFYRARTMEELGDRSKNPGDYQIAADLYSALAERHPRHPLRDNARFNQAVLLAGPLRSRTTALDLLDGIIMAFPESSMRAEAVELRGRLRGPQPQPQVRAPIQPPPQAPAQPQVPTSLPFQAPEQAEILPPTQTAPQPQAPVLPPAAPSPPIPPGFQAPEQSHTPTLPPTLDTPPSPTQTQLPPASSGRDSTPAPTQAPPSIPATPQAKISGMSGSKNLAQPAQGATLAWMEWSGDAGDISLTLGLAGRAKYRRSTLRPEGSLPWRVRLELFGAGLGDALPPEIFIKEGPLAWIRTSAGDGNTRLDLYLREARSYRVTVLRDPYRLRVDISASQTMADGESLTSPVAPAMTAQLGLTMKTIMVDAGHGGHDPGASGNGLREASLTQDLAHRLGEGLRRRDFAVLYTREGNSFMKLADRTNLANAKNVDLFISLHANYNHNKNLSGLETYYLDVARNDIAAQVAARENGISLNETSYAQIILSELNLNDKKEESLNVARLAHQTALNQLRQAGFPVRDNGVRSALLHVLAGARMPSILVEMGYISNDGDASRLKNDKYLQALAEGICNGVAAYRAQVNAQGRKP
ncbi:MAG: N-acetylmuramoyl-L-alanine amidase [Desulfovibrionaceae bacterium]|nr:N-acetylmuramoyl-L-alanine amidase [Desulfovibrionaceae bacterium]